ncbi:MAG: hypothetical protein WAL71_16230 [Terriglobales bacterium]|jgi:hypothetical protein
MANDSSKLPPYMTPGVFKTAVETLAEATVPSGPLDRRVLDKMSGADHGALMSGLGFLGYVDADRKATPEYRALIQEWNIDKTNYQARLFETLSVKYADIIGDVNVQTGTAAELEKAFKNYGVQAGQMLTKTIRFYVKMLAECGVSVSPHILKAKPRTPRAIKKLDKQQGAGIVPPPAHSPKEHTVPKGFERMSVPGLPDAFIQYPLSLTEAHCNLFTAMITTLRAFAKVQVGEKGATE